MSPESRKDREPKFQLQRRAEEMCGDSWLTQQSVNALLLLSCRIQAHILYFPGVGEGGVARSLPKWCRWKEGSTLERDLRWEQRHGCTTLNNSIAHRALLSWPTPSLWCQPTQPSWQALLVPAFLIIFNLNDISCLPFFLWNLQVSLCQSSTQN